jgi:hypothetical protein
MYETALDKELLNGEKVLWKGSPNPKKIFTKADFLLIPLSIMWGGFAVFWEYSILSIRAPFFFKLWGIPFVLIGLYFIFGRFFWKAYRKSKTLYVVTNKRVFIIYKKINSYSISTEYLDRLTSIDKDQNQRGEGTIIIGNRTNIYALFENSGMEFMIRSKGSGFSFYDIDNADEVFKIINSAREDIHSA